jgi:hypothetical protein
VIRVARSFLGLSLIGALSFASEANAIDLAQSDDFQDGSTQGWGTGSANPNPPTWSPDGGPEGAGDGFLRVSGNGSGASGGNLIAFNTAQWTGDYVAALVGELKADLSNLGGSDLAIRLLIEGPGGGFHSLAAAELRHGSGWQSFAFPLDEASLTGGFDLAATLAAVTKLRILHAPTSDGAEAIDGVLGVDNISAHSGEGCDEASEARNSCRIFCEVLECDRERRGAACARHRARYEAQTGELPPCIDADRDGVEDTLDNCPAAPNAGQDDADSDGHGDVCDNCPDDPNPGQADTFGTPGVGDVCDCPCFTTADLVPIATDPGCDAFCFESPRIGLGLTGIQCSTTRPDYSAVLEEFTDFGGEPLCQLNLPPPDASVVVVGLNESQLAMCQDSVFEAADETGLQCQ